MKLPKGYTHFDAAEFLKTEEDIAHFLDAALEGNDAAHIAQALGAIARARGMTGLAKKSGLTRASLYKALSGERNPSLDTFIRIIHALGYRLQVATQ